MERELCEICTGSYTGEFSPKWRGPWAPYFNALGEFIPYEDIQARHYRLMELRAQGRVPLGRMYGRV